MSTTTNTQSSNEGSEKFLLGLVEGFYGRPFTAEQRKDLFKKLKKYGHQLYIYAPKDDYKHRASWRELYTVEEGEHLQGLISAAKASGIDFYYALSPGLDITYSALKDTATLKRKLDQVSQFGCQHFALLFDDIESEMTKSDKEVFQSFAHAQVSISNEIYNHLSRNQPSPPNFLFCPTQYCSTRAVPSVTESEYLNTIGQKLVPAIDILWTGSKVISKILTAEEIQIITEVLKRKPLIWDNLHANDYDPKRVFLGPYNGRSPELIPLLRGVVTNPNCEFHANTIAIHTLGQWSRCNTEINNTISDTQKLETENNDDDDENPPNYLSDNIYHPRVALKNAILEWLPDFFQEKKAFGPIVKPHPAQSMAPIIPPIIPSVNTCMTLTLTTPTASSTTMATMMIPEVNTAQLHALADICSAVTGVEVLPKPSVMNSLVSATKVVTTDVLCNPIITSSISNVCIPDKMPVSSVSIPINISTEIMEVEKAPNEIVSDELMDCGTPKHISDNSLSPEIPSIDVQKDEIIKENGSPINPIEIEPEIELKNEKSQLSDDVVMAETISNNSMQIEMSDDERVGFQNITYDDILLLCDMFYLPFEHGKQGLALLNEFQWLKINANIMSNKNVDASNPEVEEWYRRSEKLFKLCDSIFLLTKKIASCVNRELCYDLFTYAWEISSVISIYVAYVKWLALGKFPENSNSYTQGSYTWFSKGWKETFMSGDQEPWVFRGGLIADLQRLIPVDSGNDLFIYKLPETPTLNFFSIRPYGNQDKAEVFSICHQTCRDGSDCSELFPQNLQEIPADRLVAPFVTLAPEFCMVVENSSRTLVGYACAALDSTNFYRSQEALWMPQMCEKYPLSMLEAPDLTQASKDAINWFHNFKYDCPASVLNLYPSILTCCILKENLDFDPSVCKRLICVLLASLRTNGSCGIHVCVNRTDSYMQHFYGKLGFTEVYHDHSKTILGRNF